MRIGEKLFLPARKIWETAIIIYVETLADKRELIRNTKLSEAVFHLASEDTTANDGVDEESFEKQAAKLRKLTKTQLQEMLKEQGKPFSGVKAKLIERLLD